MNNLVFNTTAAQLKTSIYGVAPDTSLQPIHVDVSNNLLVGINAPVTIGNVSLTVAGTVTVAEVTAPVTIGNASLTVAGTVTVAEVTAPVTIGNASLTVAGTVTVAEVTAPITIGNASLTVAGTVTVAEVTAPVTIGNASLTVAGTVTIGNATLTTLISGSTFTSDVVTSTEVTGTGVIFDNTDVSTLKNESIFIYNEGANPITISLQLSPTTTTTDYIDDDAYTDVVIAGNESSYIAVGKFAHYIRLQYNLGAVTVTFSAYYNAQA